ncbi:carbohydrate kinase [Agreia sp. PsM10]|uniref:carbohydrate kinase family protein n=1 Tax=Agreia sp. PsM10 TaxID=3030533 RepID=UPI00263A6465|nr:carbohydrate kinase [Agreia sp. PsM10]MDN4640827.1 carbohydrate kinase [Agreia sp. PsM10]
MTARHSAAEPLGRAAEGGSAVPPSVLVVGEALVDVVRHGGAVTEHPGGSAANVALGLGRLGVPVDLSTHVADDPRGHAIISHLGASGVRVRPESVAAARTSTAVATIDADGAAHYEFDVSWAFHGDTSPAADILHIGSFATFLTDPEQIIGYIERSGALEISVDPNVRPALSGEHSQAVHRFEAVARASTVIKLSDEDAAWLYPGRSHEAVIDGLLECGAGLVVLTRGARGLRLATPLHRTAVAAPHVHTVDTIGAGDTVMASLLASVRWAPSATLSAHDLQLIGTRAVAAAAITVSRSGADLPWAADTL